MDPKAADISRGQVKNAPNIEHIIERAPSLRRASEQIKHEAKRHKSSNNECVQSTSGSGVLTIKTSEHKRESEDFNLYGIQLKEEETDTIDVGPTEIHGLDTIKMDDEEDDTMCISIKTEPIEEVSTDLLESIGHGSLEAPEMAGFDIDGIQPSEEDTEDKMELFDVPLPPPFEGKPVTVTICRSGTTKKIKGVIWGDFRYSFKYKCEFYARWRCSATHKCKAKLLWAVRDGLITLSQGHNHKPLRIVNQTGINLESCTLYSVSNKYFFQQLKKHIEDIAATDVPTAMCGLADKTNELAGLRDNTIISKESVLPLASSQMDHPVIREMEESDIDDIQPNAQDTKENIDLIDVGPTEIHGLGDETMEFDGDKEDTSISRGNDEDVNNCLVAIDHDPLPPSSHGKPVTVSLCRSRITKQVNSMIWGDFRYFFRYKCKRYGRWQCTGNNYKCKARLLCDVEDGLITMNEIHNHGKRGMRHRSSTDIVSRTLYAVSNEYFRQHVSRKWKISEESALTWETNTHKDDDADTIDGNSTEMYRLDDKTYELDGHVDNTTSQISHPVFGGMEKFDIDGIQPSEKDTKENIDSIDVGPTEICGLGDETIKMEDDEDTTMRIKIEPIEHVSTDLLESIPHGSLEQAAKVEHEMQSFDDVKAKLDGDKEDNTIIKERDEDVKDDLVAIDHNPLPPPSEGKPVTVSLCRSRTTNKLQGVICGNFRYSFKHARTIYARWVCTGFQLYKCKARLLLDLEDGLIALSESHSHGEYRLRQQQSTKIVSHTLYAVSDEYFRQHVREKMKSSVFTWIPNEYIRETEDFHTYGIKPSAEDTEGKMGLVQVGPEVQVLDDETLELNGDKEDNNMTMGNDSQVAIDHDPLTTPSEGKLVSVAICRSRTTNKITGVIWDDFRYYFKYGCELYAQWACTGNTHHKCKSKLLWAMEGGLITLMQSHNHEPRRILIPHAVNLESRTLHVVSNEYFKQKVVGK